MYHTSRLPPVAPQRNRRVSANPFAAVLQGDDDDDFTVPMCNDKDNRTKEASSTNEIQLNSDSNKENLVDDHNDNDDNDDDNSQASQSSTNNKNTRVRPPRPSMAILTSRKSMLQHRRRRRSSARFLQLSNAGKNSTGSDNDEEFDETYNNNAGAGGISSQKNSNTGSLLEMYQTAIRMNAENKINSTNTWNLHIIDQMDTLLSLNEDDTNSNNKARADGDDDGHSSTATASNTRNAMPRVNFTKASCTLDASVKIYSYRVDDVHLTSYKVLANLNRTQNNNKNGSDKSTNASSEDNQNDDDDDENGNGKSQRGNASKASVGNTLETNIANININKLDSAYDIDPLFHKMSKTFDEGGAKGLLLANLGVSESSCHIVFDSSSENLSDDVGNSANKDEIVGDAQSAVSRVPEGMMDVSSLIDKLKSLLSEHSDCDDEWNIDINSTKLNTVRSIPLVPQLSALRAEHEKLVAAGCCGPDAAIALASTIGPKTPGGKVRKYHANSEQEHDADYSIHKDAIERSQRKLKFSDDDDYNVPSGNALFADDDSATFGKTTPGISMSMDDNYGGGYGYDDGVDDDDDDHGFDTFIANARYSDVSLTATPHGQMGTSTATNIISNSASKQQSAISVANLIDAISAGSTVLSNNDYEFFSSKLLNNGNNTNSSSSNEWAGAAHWKRGHDNKPASNPSTNMKKKSRKKAAKSSSSKANLDTLVSFDTSTRPDVSHLLNNRTTKSKSSSTTSSTMLSKVMIEKYTNEENVLPHDVGFSGGCSSSLQQLTKLFLHPNISIFQPLHHNPASVPSSATATNAVVEPTKSVEFLLPSTADWGGDDDDDDGPGYHFGGNEINDNDDDDEFLVPALENVRKVDKVRVGYATVAKKVDVKRLKRDLWSELELHFSRLAIENTEDEKEDVENDDTDDASGVFDTIDERKGTSTNDSGVTKLSERPTAVSFQETVRILGQQQSQTDITLPFYFICILHLANEKGLRLEQGGDINLADTVIDSSQQQQDKAYRSFLSDFTIYCDEPIIVSDEN